MKKRYYIERQASGYVGNCLLFWKKGGNGYGCNVNDAEIFGEEEAAELVKDKKYRAWEINYIDAHVVAQVDHQRLNFDLAGIGGGVACLQPEPVTRRCSICDAVFTGDVCPNQNKWDALLKAYLHDPVATFPKIDLATLPHT